MSTSSTAQTLIERPACKALEDHFRSVRSLHRRQRFAGDPRRGVRLAAEAAGIYPDYSRNRITDETMRLLAALAGACVLCDRIDAMFRGAPLNVTEQRAALHTALSAPKSARILVDGVDVVPEVHAVLDRMAAFSDEVRRGQWRRYTGKRIRNVVNIGIGGSDLGSVITYEALRHYSQHNLRFLFVSNVDTTDVAERDRLEGPLRHRLRMRRRSRPARDYHPSTGLLPPNHYLAVAIQYLFHRRPQWSRAAVGKTIASGGVIDRVSAKLGRTLYEVPVGFKWFVEGLRTARSVSGAKNPGVSFLRLDGTVWTTDKDEIVPCLLSAEMTARTGCDPGESYRELERGLGESYYERVDAPATPRQKEILGRFSPQQVRSAVLDRQKYRSLSHTREATASQLTG